ncbi:MAG: DNA N-6-adenine-methyltransferase [Candidatus Tenebribacter davisii]|nr:DNA N-6-adenine-methyltransferase [Candidatus Tenebribacter davisii]
MTAGRKIISQSQEWGTPEKYVFAVKKVLGGFIDLDPCSNEFSVVNARVEYKLPNKDGLIDTWNYPTIFVNPPYGLDSLRGTSIKNWLARCAETHEMFNSEVIALVPVATNTGHWKNCVFGRANAICFLYDTRLKFLVNGKNGGKGAPMACAMIYWGNNFNKFYDVFIDHGAVVDIRSLLKIEIGSKRNSSQLSLLSKLI